MVSPTRVNFDYGQRQEGLLVRKALFNSYIPASPVIAERSAAISSSKAPQPS